VPATDPTAKARPRTTIKTDVLENSLAQGLLKGRIWSVDLMNGIIL
jgi:hypothetical protein